MELLTIVNAKKIELIPIIYEFLGEITRHILFYDRANLERQQALELKKSIEKITKKYGFSPTIEMIEIDEDSKRDMEQIAKAFEGNRTNLYLNGSGADVALFTVLSSIVLRNGGKVIAYDKEDNSYNLITQNGFENSKIERSMKIEDFLTLMGEEILEENNKEQIKTRAQSLELLYSDAKRMFNVRYYLKQRKTKELKKRYPKVVEPLKTLGIVDENMLIKGHEGFIKFGFLFEEFVFLQLESYDFDDIKVGVKICFDQEQVKHKKIEVTNEFDILTIKNNKIGFIECKIGDSHVPLDTIYKSDSIMEYFGETASSLIVNIERDKTPHLKKSKKNFSDAIIFRAKTKKVTIYNAFDMGKNSFKNKIKQAFGVELKEEHKKQFEKDGLKSLQYKWER